MSRQDKQSYVNIGLDRILLSGQLIGLFDMDSTTVQKNTREFLNRAQKEGEIEDLSTDLPVSFLLCDGKEKKQHILFSSFSLPTLYGRIKRKFP